MFVVLMLQGVMNRMTNVIKWNNTLKISNQSIWVLKDCIIEYTLVNYDIIWPYFMVYE